MFSKVLVTLTGVFLILYTSVTSATPASAGKAQNTTQSLAPRALDVQQAPHNPHTGRCVNPFTWVRRECVGPRNRASADSRAWVDICAKPGTTQFDNKEGICDPDNYCLDTLAVTRNTWAIICAPLKNSRTHQLIEAQTGSSDPKTASLKKVFHFHYAAEIDHDMTAASVSAVFKGECHTD